ncbi:hypothetical protein [Corynebacterium nuruki]|uniref:hypothetical protein n=1 Tax=Corynebacterium nuruki TaxID=1032851 RepID=UPI002FE10E55
MTFQNTNNRPGEPSGGEDAPRRATSGQARTIIALLIVLILVVVAIGAWLIWGRGGSDRSDRGALTGATSAVPSEDQAPGQEEQPEIDSVALLENAGVQSVNPAPVPEAVDAWGDYVKNRSWSGTLRVFEGQDATPVTDDDHSRFPATMNHCGVAMYLVTFRSVNEDVLLDAQLLNAANSIDASETMSDGWMLTTNCDTPQFRFNSSTGISNLGDVAYDVTEYRQSSVAGPAGPGSADSAPAGDGGSSASPEGSRSAGTDSGAANGAPNDRDAAGPEAAGADSDPDRQRPGESRSDYTCRYWQQIMDSPLEC